MRTCTPADCIRPPSCGPESGVTFRLIGRVRRGDLNRAAIVRGGLPRFRAPRLPRAAFSGAQPLHEVTASVRKQHFHPSPRRWRDFPCFVKRAVSSWTAGRLFSRLGSSRAGRLHARRPRRSYLGTGWASTGRPALLRFVRRTSKGDGASRFRNGWRSKYRRCDPTRPGRGSGRQLERLRVHGADDPKWR